MRNSLLVTTLTTLMAGFVALTPANAQGCKLEGVELDCGDGEPAEVLTAMAAPETADLFANPIAGLKKFNHPYDLEKFRRSLEASWKSVNRAEAVQRNRMLKRKISAAEFETWSKTYQHALNNYSAGLTYYRTLVWHGKTGKAAPKG